MAMYMHKNSVDPYQTILGSNTQILIITVSSPIKCHCEIYAGLAGAVVSAFDCDAGGGGFDPQVRHIFLWKHFLLPLTQVGRQSVAGRKMGT